MLAFAKCVADATNQKRPKTLQRFVSAASSAGGDDEDGSEDPSEAADKAAKTPLCGVRGSLKATHICYCDDGDGRRVFCDEYYW